MNIPKAIEILNLRVNQLIEPDHPDLYPAIKLGIKALKFVITVRQGSEEVSANEDS